MMKWKQHATVFVAVILCYSLLAGDAPAQTAAQIFQKGGAEYLKGNFSAAEKMFRQAIAADSSFVEAHEYLGHSLYKQERYSDAIPVYRTALDLDSARHVLPLPRRRALIDNLGMSYGISGDLTAARAHFETAIRNDPNYPMYYYNLACAYGELGDLGHVLSNLRAAFKLKQNLNEYESMPDPAKDDSFRRFSQDVHFQQFLREVQR
jgi:tetratricopeptide (TPR) repeat protein